MEFLTVQETAEVLRVSPITIRRYIASGRLAAVRVGRGLRIRREAIEHFVTPVESNEQPDNSLKGQPFTFDDPLWDIVGIGRSNEPTNIAEHKDDYLADVFLPSDE